MRVSKKPFLFSIIIGLLLTSFSYFFQPLMPFQSIAHRGASTYAPENTIASFEKAVDLGFDYIELDVRFSKDGHLVVIHDADVQRTTDGEGFIGDLTVDEIKKLDAGSWFSPEFAGEKVPLLNEVLDRFTGKVGLLIEMKAPENQPGMTEVLAEMLMSYKKDGQLVKNIKVQSFHVNEMKKFHKLAPDIPAGILLSKQLDMFHLASYRQFASFLSVHHLLLSKSFIKQAELFGYDIYSWTIKKQYQFADMQRLGVHGIISDEEKRLPDSRLYALITPFLKGQDFLKTLLT
ncbi:glycerophosphodiester phosphodiesterase family protein [Aeromicrobium ponti]|uniref:Glycerophosphoryl diester phosphodiesterase n=1 Tax=Cytobacillus oceanisediminis TaxID=665099 RepID=A0A562K1G3_9BACI|nr:glycerophosphodiester phosphodiesterase family protein [Cytobacillus oceanisediminis]TWH89279.1 glycerophosphoryl diester phosphodiesterase [Cytobacillus oceanisediminis]